MDLFGCTFCLRAGFLSCLSVCLVMIDSQRLPASLLSYPQLFTAPRNIQFQNHLSCLSKPHSIFCERERPLTNFANTSEQQQPRVQLYVSHLQFVRKIETTIQIFSTDPTSTKYQGQGRVIFN